MTFRGLLSLALVSTLASAMQAYGQNTSLKFSTADGSQIEYVVAGDPNSTRTVVFIHGLGLADSFALVTEEATLQDYRLIRIHRRGYSGSSNVDAPFSLVDQAADVLALLDTLGVESAHLVGHSYGGAVALQAAAMAPQRVDSLVLIDSAPAPGLLPPPSAGGAPANPVQVAGADADRLFRAEDTAGAVEVLFSGLFGNDWQDYFNGVPGGLEQAISDADTMFMVERPAISVWMTTALDRSVLPDRILMIFGAESRLNPPPVRAAWKRAFPAAEVNEIAGTDHAVVTQAPSFVAQAIANFLAHDI